MNLFGCKFLRIHDWTEFVTHFGEQSSYFVMSITKGIETQSYGAHACLIKKLRSQAQTNGLKARFYHVNIVMLFCSRLYSYVISYFSTSLKCFIIQKVLRN